MGSNQLDKISASSEQDISPNVFQYINLIENSISTLLISVKTFQHFKFGKRIIDLKRLYLNQFYLR